MKVKIHFCILLVACAFASCETDVEPHVDYTSAIQLNKGNYWIYETATVDLLSGLRTLQLEDSTFVSKDTIADAKVYYIVENLFGLREIKTRLSDKIIDINDNIEFSGANFTDTIYRDESLAVVGFMQREIEKIRVPVGSFETVCFVVLRKNSQGHHPVTDPNNPSVFNKDYSVARKVWYARNIGVVQSVIYFANSVGFERKLQRYRVNQ